MEFNLERRSNKFIFGEPISVLGILKKNLLSTNFKFRYNNDKEILFNSNSKFFSKNCTIKIKTLKEHPVLEFTAFYRNKKPVIQFQLLDDSLEIIYHIDNKVSFFMNNLQVGAMIKGSITKTNSDLFKIYFKDNTLNNITITISILLSILLMYYDPEIENNFPIERDHFGNELKQFNHNWLPN